MVGSKIFIYPNFAMPLIVKSDHSVINSHGTALIIGSLIALKWSIKDIQRFCFSKLRSICKPMGDSLSDYHHVVIWVSLGFFLLLVFLFSLRGFLRDKKFWSVGANERFVSLFSVLVNEFLIFWIIDGIESYHTSFSLAAGIVLSDDWRSYTSNISPIVKERLLGFRHKLKIKNIQSLFPLFKTISWNSIFRWNNFLISILPPTTSDEGLKQLLLIWCLGSLPYQHKRLRLDRFLP